MAAIPFPLVAVDIGNSRVKFALFDVPPAVGAGKLPAPTRTLDLDPRSEPWDKLDAWLEAGAISGRHAGSAWWIGSVARNVTSRLVDHLRDREISEITLISAGDLPLTVALPRPDMVGIDRLLGAVAANEIRDPQRAAIVVDLGSAITVDLVAPDGAFRGGAILPGIGMSARALHEFTDLLPLIEMHALSEPPPPVGDATVPAMTSGLFWGAVGGVSRLIELFREQVGGSPQVLLTGGAAPSVAKLLPGESRYEANLVPAGIALAAARAQGR
jgi:type III pantothenate kinase